MEDLLDTKNSKLVLEGTKKDQDYWSHKIDDDIEGLKRDRSERRTIYTKRRDFFTGNQGNYSNVTNIIKDVKQKKGHTNQVINYAGKTVTKMAFALANNPPTITTIPNDYTDPIETTKAQSTQDFIDNTLDNRDNRFWKKTYRRCVFNQSVMGDAAFRVLPIDDKIRIVEHDDMANVMVGWNGLDPNEFDFVITESYLTAEAIEDQYGIKVNRKLVPEIKLDQSNTTTGSWDGNNNWGTKTPTGSQNTLPTGRNDLAKLKVVDYDCKDCYCIKIEGELVQLINKDDIKFPRMNFWIIVKNIPNPPSPWSIADIDYLVDAQIELNDNNNRTSDYIRVGGVQRYVAYNLNDFDPESIKTSSGQVIFVNSPDGTSRFDPLPTNINNFPADQYHERIMKQMYDLGLPKVNYGASGADSGRSKAIDYQSSVDLTVFKRDSWELALYELCEKIQILGHFLYPELDFFNDINGEFVVRNCEFDWTDILPVSQSDKIVNIANKYSMIGIPLRQAYKELGYRNPDAMKQELINELKDPNLMILRSKQWPLSEGLLKAQNQAVVQSQSNVAETNPSGGSTQSPVLTPEQNGPQSKPMASAQGSTSFSTPSGFIDRTRQNLTAQGR
jgi:hypothetical protein